MALAKIELPSTPVPQVGQPSGGDAAISGGAEMEVQRGKAKDLAQQFDSIFSDIVLKSMRNAVPKGGFVDGGNAEEIYRGMLDSEYSKMLSQQSGTGLATAIEANLMRAMGYKGSENSPKLQQAGLRAYGMDPLRNSEKNARMEPAPAHDARSGSEQASSATLAK